MGVLFLNVIAQALTGKRITFYGDGSQIRSFGYVEDLVESMILLMGSDDSLVGPANTGNPDEYTIRPLANLIVQISGSNSEQQF